MPKNKWEGGVPEQPADQSEAGTEAEAKQQLRTDIRSAHGILWSMAHAEVWQYKGERVFEDTVMGSKPNSDPTVAEVIEALHKAGREEERAQAHWEPRAQIEARKTEAEVRELWGFKPGEKGMTAKDRLEQSREIQSNNEALLARLMEAPREKKMNDVLREWEQTLEEQK